jgi:hypothetical protein
VVGGGSVAARKIELLLKAGAAIKVVASEVSDNTFVIKTDKPEVKVSWQVTGIRHDAFAEEHRIIPETSKTGDEIGTYQHPLEHGQPKSKGMKLPNIKKEKK